jgi:hypothetical protein
MKSSKRTIKHVTVRELASWLACGWKILSYGNSAVVVIYR